ncbi:hypothetical protein SUDANB15_06707 [Streptomyces sp. enrichment culture]
MSRSAVGASDRCWSWGTNGAPLVPQGGDRPVSGGGPAGHQQNGARGPDRLPALRAHQHSATTGRRGQAPAGRTRVGGSQGKAGSGPFPGQRPRRAFHGRHVRGSVMRCPLHHQRTKNLPGALRPAVPLQEAVRERSPPRPLALDDFHRTPVRRQVPVPGRDPLARQVGIRPVAIRSARVVPPSRSRARTPCGEPVTRQWSEQGVGKSPATAARGRPAPGTARIQRSGLRHTQPFSRVSGFFPTASVVSPAVRGPAAGPRRSPSPRRTACPPSSPGGPARPPPGSGRSSSGTQRAVRASVQVGSVPPLCWSANRQHRSPGVGSPCPRVRRFVEWGRLQGA